MALTGNQTKVLFYLAERPGIWISPTELGEDVGGKHYSLASSWGSAQAKTLLNQGHAERSDKGHYRITEQGKNAAAALKEAQGEDQR